MAKLGKDRIPLYDTTVFNLITGQFFWNHLNLHLLRIKNGTGDVIERISASSPNGPLDGLKDFNCNIETFNKEFLAALQKSDNDTQEASKRCIDGVGRHDSWLTYFLYLDMVNIVTSLVPADISADSIIAQREDFDLRADALGKWDK